MPAPEPKIIMQTKTHVLAAHTDTIRDFVAAMSQQGCTFFRATVHSDDDRRLLVEGWTDTPWDDDGMMDQGEPRWIKGADIACKIRDEVTADITEDAIRYKKIATGQSGDHWSDYISWKGLAADGFNRVKIGDGTFRFHKDGVISDEEDAVVDMKEMRELALMCMARGYNRSMFSQLAEAAFDEEDKKHNGR